MADSSKTGPDRGADGTSRTSASLSAQAREAVRQRIVDRRYPQGSRLVEREVAEELGMSRVPVREALRALVTEGLLELLPHSGVRVRRLEGTDVEHLYEVWEPLAVQASRLAARAAAGDPEGLAVLETALRQAEQAAAADEGAREVAAHTAFHEGVVALSGNPLLARTMSSSRAARCSTRRPAKSPRTPSSSSRAGSCARPAPGRSSPYPGAWKSSMPTASGFCPAWSTHIHLSTAAEARDAVLGGVTSARSGSTNFYQDIAVRELARQVPARAPRLKAAGVFVTPDLGDTVLADPDLTPLARLQDGVRSAEALRRVVEVNLARGADVIKTRVNERAGLPDQDPLTQVYSREQLSEVVTAARRGGKGVLRHSYSGRGCHDAVTGPVRGTRGRPRSCRRCES